jgi:tetratricopeptide (TPR) repeat protein
MDKDQLKEQINSKLNKAWSGSQGEEQRARLHELVMLYEQLIPLDDHPHFILEDIARIYMHLKEYGKAEVTLGKLLKIFPDQSHACFMMSEVLLEKGEFEKALEIFDKGNPRVFSEFRYNFRAKINRAWGKLEDADKDQKIYDDYEAAEKAKWDDPNHYYHYM